MGSRERSKFRREEVKELRGLFVIYVRNETKAARKLSHNFVPRTVEVPDVAIISSPADFRVVSTSSRPLFTYL